MMMTMQLIVLASAAMRKHEHKRHNLVMVGGCKVEGPGAVQTLAGGGADGTVDGVMLEGEPGFVAPVSRSIGVDGVLRLGAFGIAIVDAGRQ